MELISVFYNFFFVIFQIPQTNNMLILFIIYLTSSTVISIDVTPAASSETAAGASKLIEKLLSKTATDSVAVPTNSQLTRQARDNRYYSGRYGTGTSATGRNLKASDPSNLAVSPSSPLPNDRDLNSPNHNVERRCLRCLDGDYYDDRRYSPSGRYDRYPEDRYSGYRRPMTDYYDYDRYAGGVGTPTGRYDDRNQYDYRKYRNYDQGYDRSYERPYDRPYVPRRPYDTDRTSSYDRYDRYDPYSEMRYDPYRRPAAIDQTYGRDRYDYNRYDMSPARGYDRGYDRWGAGADVAGGAGYRPWDESMRGQSGWDYMGRGYYAGGRPETSWGGGYDRGYATNYNYGPSGSGYGPSAGGAYGGGAYGGGVSGAGGYGGAGAYGGGYRDDWRDQGYVLGYHLYHSIDPIFFFSKGIF